MSGSLGVLAATVAFVGTHFLLSHPLRRSLVTRLGERGFLGVYSLVAFVTLGWLIYEGWAVAPEPFLWVVDDALWAAATAAMLFGSILFAGSLVGNPALPGPHSDQEIGEARGVFAITRHPMMWGFALWALVHIAVYPTASSIIIALAILILALVGAHLQDRKKAELQRYSWPRWQARTSYWPFVALLRGKTEWPSDRRWWSAVGAGTLLWLVASWAHMPISGWAAGIWRWI